MGPARRPARLVILREHVWLFDLLAFNARDFRAQPLVKRQACLQVLLRVLPIRKPTRQPSQPCNLCCHCRGKRRAPRPWTGSPPGGPFLLASVLSAADMGARRPGLVHHVLHPLQHGFAE